MILRVLGGPEVLFLVMSSYWPTCCPPLTFFCLPVFKRVSFYLLTIPQLGLPLVLNVI